MAKISQELIKVTLSTIVRDNDTNSKDVSLISDEQLETLQAAVEGLLEKDSIVVEVNR